MRTTTASAQSRTKQKTSGATKSTDEKSESEEARGLRELFIAELKDIYWAEKALTKAIPKIIKKTTSEDLSEALSNHLDQTEEHVSRLERVFESIGVKAVAKKCEAMEGLLAEGETIIEETEEGVVRDAGIISAAQKVEHYEIATYGTLVAFAKVLGEDEVISLLHETLEEEKDADDKLSEIADIINAEATEKEEEEAEEE